MPNVCTLEHGSIHSAPVSPSVPSSPVRRSAAVVVRQARVRRSPSTTSQDRPSTDVDQVGVILLIADHCAAYRPCPRSRLGRTSERVPERVSYALSLGARHVLFVQIPEWGPDVPARSSPRKG